MANAADTLAKNNSCLSVMSFKNIFFSKSCETDVEITSNNPAAVESAAASPPAATKAMTQFGKPAISGMITGLFFTASYIIYFKFINPSANSAENWWLGISPEGIGTLGMLFNFIVSNLVSRITAPPPKEIRELVDEIRVPRGAGASYHHIKS